jgi:hypothetical protein
MGILSGSDLCLGWESVECSSFHAQYAMANDNKPQKDRADNSARNKKVKAPAERPFDMWLQKQLHAMYDEITAEPLPDDLMKLIERDAESKNKRSRKK